MKPPLYWRLNKNWSNWLGKQGKVIAATLVRVASPECEPLLPFSYVIVDFGQEKKEMMGADHEIFTIGDQVECVLRKTAQNEPHELIDYGIKVTKIKN